jgi:hypothetical protein
MDFKRKFNFFKSHKNPYLGPLSITISNMGPTNFEQKIEFLKPIKTHIRDRYV